MKKSIVILTLLIMATSGFSQINKPADGKSLVYFVRASGMGALINFKYFDGEKYLGKLSNVNYVAYECEPGEHLFWVASENRDYLQGNLEANSTYIIEVRPTMGAIKAAVRLYQIDPNDPKAMKRINKVIAKRQPSELKGDDEDMAFFIKNGMERFEKIKDDVKQINSAWAVK